MILKLNQAEGGYIVDVTADCGIVHEAVAEIQDIDNPNPLVRIPEFLGARAVRAIAEVALDMGREE